MVHFADINALCLAWPCAELPCDPASDVAPDFCISLQQVLVQGSGASVLYASFWGPLCSVSR